MTTKSRIAAALIAVATLGVIVWLLATRTAPQATIDIGVSAPLTGESANYGRSTQEGVELAVAELNAAHYLPRPLHAIYEDDRMNPRDGVAAVSKLISVDHVPLILGPFGSSVVLAAAPIANKAQVVILSASATADSIADAGDFVFRIAPPNSRQGRDIADFLASQNAKTAAVIQQNNDYGTTLAAAFSARFTELGGKVVATEFVEDGATDVRAQVTKIREAAPDAVFFPLHYSESAIFLTQARQLGLTATMASADGAMTADMLRLAGPTAEGTYYTTLAVASDDPTQAKRFQSTFRAKYGHEADPYAAYYYDALKLSAQALRDTSYSGTAIRDYFYDLGSKGGFSGVSGAIVFDKLGEVSKGFSLFVVADGAFRPLDRRSAEASQASDPRP